jgi:uncharacterized membrane protein
MKALLTIITLVAITFSGFSSEDENAKKSSTNSTTISGVVVDKNTGETLVGAVISVNGEEKIKTDLDGKFEIKNLEPGQYTISVDYISYKAVDMKVETSSKQNEKVEFALEIVD